MRILYLANLVSVHTRKWVNFFAQEGHDVHVVTWQEQIGTSTLNDAVEVHKVLCPPHYAARYGTVLEVMHIAHSMKPDLIHAHYLSHFGIVGGLHSRVTGFHPLVLTAWGSDVLIDSRGWKQRLVSHAIAQADCITCDSPHMVPRLAELGAQQDKIVTINFGVDTDCFRPQQTGSDIRAALHLGDAPVVVSLRSLQPIYDVATLVRAAPAVQAEIPNTVFVIAGGGEERAALQALAASLGIAANMRFMGIVSNDSLPDYLNCADVYVSTSLSDAGIAASTAEAMACGLPAVVTDFGDNGSWVRDGDTGYLFPCGDEEALAERLILVLRDAELRKRLGANARREIVERNDYHREMARMEHVYTELIERYKKK